jgi:hypothetical protein
VLASIYSDQRIATATAYLEGRGRENKEGKEVGGREGTGGKRKKGKVGSKLRGEERKWKCSMIMIMKVSCRVA